MIRGLVILAFLLTGIIVGPIWAGQSGYVLIIIAGYRVETSVVILVLALVAVIALWWLVEALVKRLLASKRRGFSWLSGRRRRKAEKRFQQALESWLSHDWASAEHLAKEAAVGLTKPQYGYLLAAMAAEQRQDMVARYNYLQQAASADSSTNLPIELAELERENAEIANQRLADILLRYPQHDGVFRLASEICAKHGLWATLRPLLPRLAQRNLVTPKQLIRYTRQCFNHYFTEANGDLKELKQRWQSLDKKQRYDAVIRIEYIQQLQHHGHLDIASKVAANGLRKHALDASDLLFTPTRLHWGAAQALMEVIQQQIKQQPNDTQLLALLGLVAMHQNDQELAQRALGKAVEAAPSRRFWQLLGDSYLAADNSSQALRAYRQASEQHD